MIMDILIMKMDIHGTIEINGVDMDVIDQDVECNIITLIHMDNNYGKDKDMDKIVMLK